MSEKTRFLERVWCKSKLESKLLKGRLPRTSTLAFEIAKEAKSVEGHCMDIPFTHKHVESEKQLKVEVAEVKYFEIPIVSITNEYEIRPVSPSKSVSFGTNKVVVFSDDFNRELQEVSESSLKDVLNNDYQNLNPNLQAFGNNEDATEVPIPNKNKASVLGKAKPNENETERNQDILTCITSLFKEGGVQELYTLCIDKDMQQKLKDVSDQQTFSKGTIPSFTMLHKYLSHLPRGSISVTTNPYNWKQFNTQCDHKAEDTSVNSSKHGLDKFSEKAIHLSSKGSENGLLSFDNENQSTGESREAPASQENKQEQVANSIFESALETELETQISCGEPQVTLNSQSSRHGLPSQYKETSHLNRHEEPLNKRAFPPSTAPRKGCLKSEGFVKSIPNEHDSLMTPEESNFARLIESKADDYHYENEKLFNQDMDDLRREQQALLDHPATTFGDPRVSDIKNTYDNNYLRYELATLRSWYGMVIQLKKQEIKKLEQNLTEQLRQSQDLKQKCDLILEEFARISLRTSRESITYKETLEEVKQLRNEVRAKSKQTNESIRDYQKLKGYYRDYNIALGRVVSISCKFLALISCDPYINLFRLMATFNVSYPSDQELTNLRELLPKAMRVTIASYMNAQKNQTLQTRKLKRALKDERQKLKNYKQYVSRNFTLRKNHTKHRGLIALSSPKSLTWQRAA